MYKPVEEVVATGCKRIEESKAGLSQHPVLSKQQEEEERQGCFLNLSWKNGLTNLYLLKLFLFSEDGCCFVTAYLFLSAHQKHVNIYLKHDCWLKK